MTEIFNRSAETLKRRQLRQARPPAEALLWQRLRNRQLGGFKFRRQYGIAHYVTDFCCPECRLIVELDGATHESDAAVAYDANRTLYFEALGFVVVRFTNEQVYRAMPAILEMLLALCLQRQNLTPGPSPSQGEGSHIQTLQLDSNFQTSANVAVRLPSP